MPSDLLRLACLLGRAAWAGALRRRRGRARVLAAVLAALVAGALPAGATENEECLDCHDDPEFTGRRQGRVISLHVDPDVYAASVHGDLDCVFCHEDLDGTDYPHAKDPAPVDCSACHDEEAEAYAKGVHELSCAECHGTHDVRAAGTEGGISCTDCHDEMVEALDRSVHVGRWECTSCHGTHEVRPPATYHGVNCAECHEEEATAHDLSRHGEAWRLRQDELAPTCAHCHGGHEILSHHEEGSPTFIMNIPLLCGRCHHEGSEVSLTHEIPRDRIFENYSMSMHGDGLFRKGLRFTAVCTTCHTSHRVLPHTDPDSSIHRDRIVELCTECHAEIALVHQQVIEGEAWQREIGQIPICVDCHSPHRLRREEASPAEMAQGRCLACHSNPGLTMVRDGQVVSLYVDPATYAVSVHGETECASCHTEVRRPQSPEDRPCRPIRSKVDCATCHEEQVAEYQSSTHGTLAAQGDPDAPVCLDCHTNHATLSRADPRSRTFPRRVPSLCASCHREGEKAARRIESEVPDIVGSYLMSIHGQGMLDSGLVVTATCVSCHTAHHELPPTDPASSVHTDNIPKTCGKCHHGIEEEFQKSIHWPGNTDTDLPLPTCEDCHTSHEIARTEGHDFRKLMMNQCGGCHREETETFFDTAHGQKTRLEDPKTERPAAKCFHCHGTHRILPRTDPASTLSRENIVGTCAQCHAGAHERFTGYLTHATHHDRRRFPWLFWSFWGMTALLVGTLSFALLHTAAWLVRLWRSRDQWREHKALARIARGQRLYRRFDRYQRTLHILMMLAFFTLAITGMSLKFAYMGWARVVGILLGGAESMGVLHRVAAVVLFGVFFAHLRMVFRMKRKSGQTWRQIITGPHSIIFNKNDWHEFKASVRWFFGRGPRPQYGRYTYWEKFDYFAVFWGVAVIGITGLMLWFPVLFTRVVPGDFLNVAQIIHSDEALLAVAFIFTVHFFNTHFRPDKFPMDRVIFTGRVTVDELKYDKPKEYEALVASGELEENLVQPFPDTVERGFKIFGFLALGLGLLLIALIVYTVVFGYAPKTLS